MTRLDFLPLQAIFGKLIVLPIDPVESQTIDQVRLAISFARNPALKLNKKMTLFRTG